MDALDNQNSDAGNRGAYEEIRPLTDERVERVLQGLYQRIENEALRLYKSNDVVALRAYFVHHILNEYGCAPNEETSDLADRLLGPVKGKVNEDFNPLAYVRAKLEAEGLVPDTIRHYCFALAALVAYAGRREHYNDEILDVYVLELRKRYPKTSTFNGNLRYLTQALRRLRNGKRREFPFKLRKSDEELHRPFFTKKEVEQIIWACATKYVRPDTVVRVATCTLYGTRMAEVIQIGPKDIHLDGPDSHIMIRTKKGGVQKPQPIPEELIPIFDIPFEDHVWAGRMTRELDGLCRKAKVPRPKGKSIHAFRRSVVTELRRTGTNVDDAHQFLRLADNPFRSVIPRYDMRTTDEVDHKVLAAHPYASIWAKAVPYLIVRNRLYREVRKQLGKCDLQYVNHNNRGTISTRGRTKTDEH